MKHSSDIKKHKTVHLVAATELKKLEGQTRRLLHSHKTWIVDEADKTRNGFRPHITVPSTGQVFEGMIFHVTDYILCLSTVVSNK